MAQIDLNCDMGESFGKYVLGADEQLIKFITSANIACGFHAGDPATMRKTVRLALDHSVCIGAHPGLQDLTGFGRRNISITPEEAYDLMMYQIGALLAFITSEGGKLHHVKPHGALYNMAAHDEQLADAIAKAVYKIDPALILYGLSGSQLIQAGEKYGLRTANEVFADRTYMQDGSLTPRSHHNAVITDEDVAIKQVMEMITEQKVSTITGERINLKADTICLHGDGKHAVAFASKMSKALQNAGLVLKGISQQISS
ncbi:5-oxoprolinase subunit PxpA [Metabacillus malikii]|uniref:5-oxoprolinase subunit A n=1 Tax=Metabacillus malikii TaxID=1504265 RepID=A0ABT9ZER9_9BACI|nr:5-oxoprolinase subunit PxpA [Metabacillus malikii]MDQ0230772.1 UPF0271 protein [Metabacillus malikii]